MRKLGLWGVLILLAVMFNTTNASADVSWVKCRLGQPLPAGAILGGVEKSGVNDGKSLYVCRAQHAGGIHPGKLIGGQCNIPYGGHEYEKPEFEVAVGSGTWGKPQPGYAGALVGGQEPGRTLYVCRVNYQEAGWGIIQHGFHPGKVVEGKCNFGFGGKEIDIFTDFEVFYPNATQASTPPPAQKKHGMLINFTSGPGDFGGSVSVTNKSTGKVGTETLERGITAGQCAIRTLTACTKANLECSLSGLTGIEIYGTGNIVNVVGATINKNDF